METINIETQTIKLQGMRLYKQEYQSFQRYTYTNTFHVESKFYSPPPSLATEKAVKKDDLLVCNVP
jgi:hypothetical protein